MDVAPHLNDASAAAVRFLVDARGEDRLWKDFGTLAGHSTDWVTAFVTYVLSYAFPSHPGHTASLRVICRRQRPAGGWGYNAKVPPDCDSTAWALLALTTNLTTSFSARKKASAYILRHFQRETGGFTTYSPEDGIEMFIQTPSRRAARGWLSAHACVSGLAIQALLAAGTAPPEVMAAVKSYLLAERGEDGLWHSAYWWNGCTYTTFHALKALAWLEAVSLSEWKRAGRTLLALQGEGGAWKPAQDAPDSVFETAFALLALLPLTDGESVAGAHRAAAWLLAQQNADGSWSSSPMLRIPPPQMRRPSDHGVWRRNSLGTGVIIQDDARLFTSAAALWSLATYQSAFAPAGRATLPPCDKRV